MSVITTEATMNSQQEKASLFHSLHVPGMPVILYNVWDAGSAKTVTAAGARAIASTSWAVAAAHGCTDGEQLPLELVLANAARIVQATSLPVSIDIESGYGGSAADVANTVRSLLETGAIGCNIEDSFPGDGRVRPVAQQVERLSAARAVANAAGVRLFINARTDIFFEAPANQHSRSLIAAVLERAQAYAAAGADGLFVPGLKNFELIRELCEDSPLPVNVMLDDTTESVEKLASLRVARLSYGPAPYLLAMRALTEQARETFSVQHVNAASSSDAIRCHVA
jgi:2-methylisocitrate lyase-like PEP mutase family enzyme